MSVSLNLSDELLELGSVPTWMDTSHPVSRPVTHIVSGVDMECVCGVALATPVACTAGVEHGLVAVSRSRLAFNRDTIEPLYRSHIQRLCRISSTWTVTRDIAGREAVEQLGWVIDPFGFVEADQAHQRSYAMTVTMLSDGIMFDVEDALGKVRYTFTCHIPQF
jgi:hypothetical protein